MNGTNAWDDADRSGSGNDNAQDGTPNTAPKSGQDNARETGARTLTGSRETGQETDQRAAENDPPRDGQGLSEPKDGSVDHGDGVNPPAEHHDIIKETGAGPAISRHSKDAR